MLAIDSDRTRRYLSGACVSGLGLLILLVPLYDIWDDLRNLSWGLLWTLLENSALLVLASGLVLAGVWIVRLDWESKYVVTVAKWNLLVGGGIAALFLWIVAIQLRVMQEPKPYVLALNGVLFGVVAAFGVGVYNASRQRHTDELRARERELQRMYDRVSESERRYRTLAERFPDGIVALFDEQPTFYLSAGEAFDQLPLDPADLDGKAPHQVFRAEVAKAVEPALQAALDGNRERVDIECAGRHWLVRTIPVTDDRGEVFAGLLMCQDITELITYQRRLEASNERLEQFAYAVSHDLQEPLRMVSSYLELIEDRYADGLDADGEEFIDYAVDGADRMREMIEGLLEYSRVETQGDSLDPIDLNAVLADVREDLQVKLEERDADLAVGDLPRVEGDASQLRQVFQNLLENAIEYSGDEPPRIRVSAERRGSTRAREPQHDSRDPVATRGAPADATGPSGDGQEWVISVADEGIGIDPDDADRIFRIFERLHATEDQSGTGIGLALCQHIVERHGGEIWVDSEPGAGTTFSFTLPAATDDRGTTDRESNPRTD
ncbi:multi-sensor signal transduction histidine kinase [Haloterrigena turkmenica DSM 5511]|uniref:histidine kinase n=1 Tax=Haloterrigena turkmenica (strain ATCC 51198 / DSM 5511 / JCM 9101 / NCIMB 13204 / VKM B-1734 / 4k) TaxID=543526 RepID=D2RSJ0_HALTV|nr:ATP-binding protein [Haloterrigena turkmenica]ADB60766.1 multi-sensor signal transduction histidine kinase [Haloterrigena turkmenica DSM 5511]